MSNEIKPVNSAHGNFEHRDISMSGVVSFLLFLAAACVLTAFVVNGLYKYLDKRNEADQPAISPLVTNAPKDTRHLATGYEQYLQQNFPAPRLELDERTQLDKIRLEEEETLATYSWIDQSAGRVRIPIERAMDLIVERGLPVRQQGENEQSTQNENKKK